MTEAQLNLQLSYFKHLLDLDSIHKQGMNEADKSILFQI